MNDADIWKQACKNESNSRAELQRTCVEFGNKLVKANARIEELKDALMSIKQVSSEPRIKKWAAEALEQSE